MSLPKKTVSIPVKLVNNRNYYNVKIFPQKVKVTFTTSLSGMPKWMRIFLKPRPILIFGTIMVILLTRKAYPYARILQNSKDRTAEY